MVSKLRRRGTGCAARRKTPTRLRLRGHGSTGQAGAYPFGARGRGWRSGSGLLLELATATVELVDQTAESERRVALALERNRVLGKGLKVGKSFKVEGSDGASWYEITRVAPASVEVEWRDYGRDRCMDEMLAGGGEFALPLIAQLIHHHDALHELSEALA